MTRALRSAHPRPPARAIPEIAALVTRMAAANPLWGAPRIHGELLKLGFHVADAHRLPAHPKAPTSTSSWVKSGKRKGLAEAIGPVRFNTRMRLRWARAQ